jgi:predicted dienelactone hydrolase
MRWRRCRTIIIRLAFVGCLVLASGETALWVLHARPVELPAPTGPFAIGRVEYGWIDHARRETLGGASGADRAVAAWIWYPSVSTGKPVAPYLPPRWLAARQDNFSIFAPFTQDLNAVRAHAVADAPLAPATQTYPVILLLPGLGPIAGDYTTIAEDLASHGYVVVGLTPPYSASVAILPDGSVARATPAGGVPDSATPQQSKQILDRLIAIWAADASFALDQLTRLDAAEPPGPFAGHLDLGAVGIIGHSFGGATAAQVCATDRRCRVGVDLDGYPYGTVVNSGLTRPFLFIWSEPDDPTDPGWQQALGDMRTLTTASAGGVLQLSIRGARHFDFTDLTTFYNPLLRAEGVFGTIDGRRALAITAAYTRAFLDRTLRGTAVPLLDGPRSAYPEVRFGPPAGTP